MESETSNADHYPWRLAGFDLDGTLIYGTTVLLHLGQKLSAMGFVQELVEGYESYRLTNKGVSTAAAVLFKGWRKEDLVVLLEDVPCLDDIDPTVQYLKKRGVRCVVASVTFGFASEWFARRFGFDDYSGIDLMVDDEGRYTGEVSRHFDEHDKRRFIINQCRDLGVDGSNAFFIGDSRSDLPTFGFVGFSVALNASNPARAIASLAIDSRSLLEAVRFVPGVMATDR